MDEDRLSPEMGRLIDAAKAAAARAAAGSIRAEGVTLLTAGGRVHCGCAQVPAGVSGCAAESALASMRLAGDSEVLAAAVTVANDPSETVLPSHASIRALQNLDPDTPVIVKKLGRWVVLPLSQLSGRT